MRTRRFLKFERVRWQETDHTETTQRSQELAAKIETAIGQYGLQQRAGVFASVERVS